MFAQRRLNELATHRRLLVMEAELHRSLIGLERTSLRERLASLQTAREKVAATRPLLMAGGAVTGLLAIRLWRKLARWIPAVLTVLRCVQSLKGKRTDLPNVSAAGSSKQKEQM